MVFSGDTKQIQSVEAYDALRVLEKESRLKSIGLTEVRRQTAKDYSDAIKELRRDPSRGFEKFEAIGAVHEVAWLSRAQAVAKAFIDAELRGRNALVVCATHEEIDRVTEAIRSIRKKRGKLGEGVQIGRDVSLNWTTAQKSNMRNFHLGQFLVFHRAVNGIAKNEVVEVARVENKRVIVRNERGESRAITTKQAKSFDVCERRAFEIAPGDKLLVTANRRGLGFRVTNGEIVTVNRMFDGAAVGIGAYAEGTAGAATGNESRLYGSLQSRTPGSSIHIATGQTTNVARGSQAWTRNGESL
jgi:hypothetical protein